MTGAHYILEEGNDKIAIDCGLQQSSTYCEPANFDAFPYDVKSLQAVLITHAHIDHVGRLPKLYRDGFRGKIYSTPPTKDFSLELLKDSGDILSREAQAIGKEQLYSLDDIDKTMALWETVLYKQPVEIAGFKVSFRNTGHILGSAAIVIERNGKTIVFSGDVGNVNPPIIKPCEALTDIPADYCLIESAYGDRLHKIGADRSGEIEDIIEDTAHRKGVLLIPSFAMERAQELLYTINELVENERVPKVPIYIDSPLAIRLTALYKWYEDYFQADAWKYVPNDKSLFNFPGLHISLTREQSQAIKEAPSPKIIMAGSGMSQGGRIVFHEKIYLPDAKNTILFAGYQAEGSLGRKILEGAKEVEIMGQKVAVNASVVSIDSYSAHADQKGLMEWIYPMRHTLKKVFVVQGEKSSSATLAGKLRDEFALDAMVPEPNFEFEL